MARVELHGNQPLRDQQIEKIPNRLRGTYALWLERRPVIELMTRATFYRHRQDLRAFGIDISTPPATGEHVNVVPLLRVIEARPKGIPQWAYGTPLLAAA